MRNGFVDYLNTLHNVSGANTNSLAESQATEPYYEHIRVRRRIGVRIADLLRAEARCIILTGHAGDGKTGLLHQILVDLGVVEGNDALSESATQYIPGIARTVHYIKDMSELAAIEQEEHLLQALACTQKGNCAILVSNTGPLLNTFKRLQDNGQLPGEFRTYQTELLDAMDVLDLKPIELNGYSFTMINMARIDNTGMAGLLMQKMAANQLWEPCETCTACTTCPVLNNATTVKENLPHITRFMETYLSWLHENDCRLTLRQIIAQIAYAMTHDLSCESVHKLAPTKRNLFNYHFANGLWGCHGFRSGHAHLQIRGIEALVDLDLDGTATSTDYDIFVRKDLSAFDNKTKEIINYNIRPLATGFTKADNPAELRKSVRRFHLLFGSKQSVESLDRLTKELFSPVQPIYQRVMDGESNNSDHHLLRQWITRGLYTSIVGVPPMGNIKSVPITVRPEGSGVLGVQLQIGEVPTQHFEVYPKRRETYGDFMEAKDSHVLGLKLRGAANHHPISLPLLDYLYHLGEGVISTRLNPSLTHGIDRIKVSLMEYVGDPEEHVRLLVLKSDGPTEVEFTIDEETHRLIVR